MAEPGWNRTTRPLSRQPLLPPTVLRGVRPYGEEPVDLLIDHGRIAALDPAGQGPAVHSIDCHGLIALPALTDLHTHLRQPGAEDAETIASGTLAAAKGGYATVFAMANTQPVADDPRRVEYVAEVAERTAHCQVRPVGAVTVGLGGTALAPIEAMAASAARTRMFSDDGRCVEDPALMRQALRRAADAGGFIAQHAQSSPLTPNAQANDGAAARELGLPGWPAVAEEVIIARDCVLAGADDTPLHICHVSTRGSVEIIRWAKSRGWPVTAEVTPHHLLLTDELVHTGDTSYKVNPPLRSARDVTALREALAEGVIDVVATDHAPHPAAAKNRPWNDAPPGMLGLETALPVVAETMVRTGLMSWRRLSEAMAIRPAAIGGTGADGSDPLQVGMPATLCLVSTNADWTVDAARLASLARNTPFSGQRFTARVVATIIGGRLAWSTGPVPDGST
ncbi:dihydroorotase [Micromonospora sp. DR5-3]|nr:MULTISPECIES: dihydroorotase [unclassified Micromonospora]MCW3819663.1 dihydroorotase [Micromonospora sp. DR5-3]TYC19865.1 dihydroorotase [Micromonospora sp. MP36]